MLSECCIIIFLLLLFSLFILAAGIMIGQYIERKNWNKLIFAKKLPGPFDKWKFITDEIETRKTNA